MIKIRSAKIEIKFCGPVSKSQKGKIVNTNIDAEHILKSFKLPYKKKDSRKIDPDNDKDVIEISLQVVANGNYTANIHNYMQSTSWKDYTEYFKSFDTPEEFIKKLKPTLNRYKKLGFEFVVPTNTHLLNFIYVLKKGYNK